MLAERPISPSTLAVKDLPWQIDWDKSACTLCGRCTTVCPVNAIYERDHVHPVEEAIVNPDKHVVVQTAPAIRAALVVDQVTEMVVSYDPT